MERKTKVTAADGRHDILITRDFDLPVELLFRAHAEADLFGQWMSHEYGTTKVTKFEARSHGGWCFQTTDAQGNVLFEANGVFHAFVPNQSITRTFEMANTPFPVQLEFLEFEKRTDHTSTLSMHMIFRSAEHRDALLKMPFAQGLHMAHNRLQAVVSRLI